MQTMIEKLNAIADQLNMPVCGDKDSQWRELDRSIITENGLSWEDVVKARFDDIRISVQTGFDNFVVFPPVKRQVKQKRDTTMQTKIAYDPFIVQLIAEASDYRIRDNAVDHIKNVVALAVKMNPQSLAAFYQMAELAIEQAELEMMQNAIATV